MKSVLQCSLLVLAALSAAQVQADEGEGGEGCLPGGYANPIIQLGSADSLIEWQWPTGPDPSPEGANCNSARVRAVLPNSVPGAVLESTPRDHTYAWTLDSTEAMRHRTLYIRAGDTTALLGREPLMMEIYRQTLLPTQLDLSRNPIELRVLLVRAPTMTVRASERQPVLTEVWVIAHDIHSQLGFLRTPILVETSAQCTQTVQQPSGPVVNSFGACLEIQATLDELRVTLRGNRGDQTMSLSPAVVSQILLGNVATTSGGQSDVFHLAHSAVPN